MSSAHHRDARQNVPYRPSPPIIPGGRFEGERDLLQVMVGHILAIRPSSGAEALRVLRDAFPESPLPLRVAALRMTMGPRTG
jgi:hypothetical protein